MKDYCAAFKSWLLTDMKQPPPDCKCGQASALRRLARDLRKQADVRDVTANNLIEAAHG